MIYFTIYTWVWLLVLYVCYVHAVALRGQKGFGSLRTGVESVAELPNVSAGNQTSARGVRYP